jgi:hypothetical protein
VNITLDSPWKMATLVMMPPTTISQKPSQAIFGVASRHLSSVDEAK